MKKTAVEWLEFRYKNNISLHQGDFEEAKEMEKQQQDNFAIDFYNWCNSEEALDLIQDLQIVGELNKIITTKELLKIFKNK